MSLTFFDIFSIRVSLGINVPRNETIRLASDHLPLCAELLLDNRDSGVPAAD